MADIDVSVLMMSKAYMVGIMAWSAPTVNVEYYYPKYAYVGESWKSRASEINVILMLD